MAVAASEPGAVATGQRFNLIKRRDWQYAWRVFCRSLPLSVLMSSTFCANLASIRNLSERAETLECADLSALWFSGGLAPPVGKHSIKLVSLQFADD